MENNIINSALPKPGEINPVSSIRRMIELAKAGSLDVFLVFYIILLIHRIIINKLILDRSDALFSWPQITVVFIISLFCGIIWTVTKTSPGCKLLGISKENKITKWGVIVFGWLLFNSTFISGWIITKISILDLFSFEGIQGANRIFGAMFHPNTGIFDEALFAIIETIYLALMATLISIPPTFVLSFFTARNLMKDNKFTFVLYYLLRILFNFIRSIEPLIWAIIFSVWVGIGPYAGMIALLVHSIASNTKLFSEAIEGIEQGPVEAIVATGANKIQVVWFAVVPQILLPLLSFTIYRWDINVRMATVIGLVGGGGIGTMLMQYQGLARWNEVGLIVLMIAIVVWIMDYVSAKIREAIY